MHPVQPHGKIAGYIKPERHLLLLPGPRIALRQLIEKRFGFDETEKLRLKDLARCLVAL
jgi:hypothetical protein